MASGCGIHIMTDPTCVSCRGGQWSDAVRHAQGPKDPFSAAAGLFPQKSAAERARARRESAAFTAAFYTAAMPFGILILIVFVIMVALAALAGIALRGIEATLYASMLAWPATLTAILCAAIFGPSITFTREGLTDAAPRLTKIGLATGFVVFLTAFLFFASEGVPYVSRDNLSYDL